MGAWGTGVFENDAVYNILDAMEDLIDYREDGVEPYTAGTIISYVPYVDLDNDEVLAFLVKFYSDFGIVEQVEYLFPQLEALLSVEALSRWTHPQERLDVMQSLYDECCEMLSGTAPVYADDEESVHDWIRRIKNHD